MISPSVSVVVPVLNGCETLGDLLTALSHQAETTCDLEIFVVDNGSTDGSQEIVCASGVAKLLEEPVRGPAAARNRGLQEAHGDVIAFVDADMLPTRRWLSELVKPFSDEKVMIVAGQTIAYRPSTPAERYTAACGVWDTQRAVQRRPFPFAPSGNMAVRREAAIGVGGWANDMLTAEDVDFSFRVLRQFPGEIVYGQEAITFHRHRPTTEGLRKQAFTYGEGAADFYLRYPDVVRWDLRKRAKVGGWILRRSVVPIVLAIGRRIGLGSDEGLEFARFHRLWTWWFWRGFHGMYRHRERRPYRGRDSRHPQ